MFSYALFGLSTPTPSSGGARGAAATVASSPPVRSRAARAWVAGHGELRHTRPRCLPASRRPRVAVQVATWSDPCVEVRSPLCG